MAAEVSSLLVLDDNSNNNNNNNNNRITITITVIIIIKTAIIPAVTAIRQKLQQLLHRRLTPLPRQIAIPMLIRLQLINYKILLKILLKKHY